MEATLKIFGPTTAEIDVSYVEPTTTQNGTPLDDLSHTVLSVKHEGVEIFQATIPAINPEGGTHIAETVEVDLLPGERKVLDVSVVAIDGMGNASTPTMAQLGLDREAPGPVQ